MEHDNKALWIFPNIRESVNCLPEELKGEAYKAMIEYGFGAEVNTDKMNPMVKMAFELAKPFLRLRGVAGAPQGNQNAKKEEKNNIENNIEKQSKTILIDQKNNSFNNHNDNKNDNINDNGNEKESVKEKVAIAPRFIKPTIQEVQSYIAEQGLDMDAQAFVDFYESKGWKVGSSAMKDWKAAVRNWARRDRRKLNESYQVPVAEQKTETIDDIIERMKREEHYEQAI